MQEKVLIVDDMEINRDILEAILEDEYSVLLAETGKQALEIIDKYKEDIKMILLDLVMPEMDGFGVLRAMKERAMIGRIPVLVITGEGSIEIEKKCFDCGVSDFARKPFDNILIKKRVKNIMELFLHKNELEKLVEEQTETVKIQYKLLEAQAEELQQNNENIIEILGSVVEYRDVESGEHIKRVKYFSKILATYLMEEYPECGLTPEKIAIITSASALHDIGKIAIPDNVLLKPGKFTDEEFAIMKTHTTKGGQILNDIRGAWDEDYGAACYDICMYHHERYDGRGYPKGLKGEEIPISAQIVSVADVYDALVQKRVYKDAFSLEEAYQMIMDGKCGAFSPKLLHCFSKAKAEFEEMAERFK